MEKSIRLLFVSIWNCVAAFCLTVEQPYMIITRTSQTLSSKKKPNYLAFKNPFTHLQLSVDGSSTKGLRYGYKMVREVLFRFGDIFCSSIFFTNFSIKYTTNLIACFALYLAAASAQINVCFDFVRNDFFNFARF
jgi:hypothetical protein